MKEHYQLIDRILLTEKGTVLTETQNKYVFKVPPNANKLEIKQAIQSFFPGVKVAAVNTMNFKGKKKRERTANYGRTAAWKKAVITLAEDSEPIELA